MRELDDVNRDQILGVPLFVHGPGMEPGIDDRPAQTVDVVPTIAGLLGVHIPWKVDGRDLSRPATPRPAAHPVGIGHDFNPSLHVDSIDVSGHLAALLALARTHAVPYASPDPDLSVLRTGPHGALIGRPLTDFATTGDDGGRQWQRDYPDDAAFDHVDLGGALPAYVNGRLEHGHPDDAVVGVVNGRIAGVGVMSTRRTSASRCSSIPRTSRRGRTTCASSSRRDDHTLAPL